MKQVDGMPQADAVAWLRTARDVAYADLYTFTLADGSVWRFTSADVDLRALGQTWRSSGIAIARGGFSTQLAVQVQTLALTVTPDREDPSLAAFCAALDYTTLRGVRVEWRGWYGDDWSAPRLTVLEFAGRVSDIADEEATTINCYSDLALLNTNMPRNIYSATCLWEVFDTGCGLLRSTYTEAAVTGAGSSRIAVFLAGTSHPAGYYTGGGLRVAAGPLAGTEVSVRLHVVVGSTHVLALTTPLDAVLTAGSALEVWPGCDRAQATCGGKFGNVVHFRGMPYIPVPETVT